MPLIMGTAGHIDHGKTTLIKALTGIDCDRLKEEKKRGITIELGFAFLDMPDGGRLGVIDVPGHERFVKNMVAGAAGVDFALLVIAADEGVMPQTREHLEICTLLGIRHGLVALTKTDMVDEDWLEMVTDDVSGALADTFLAEAPIMPVSAHTGQGLDELRAAIAELAGTYDSHRRSDLFRLPVDRIFTMKGHGTVVTGTLVSGSISEGEDVRLYPKGTVTKVRGLQSHGTSVTEAPAGRRTAVNLAGLEVEDVTRGEVLARPGSLFPSLVWDVELDYLPSAGRELKHRREVHLHHGAREVLARIHLLDRDALRPGDKVICQIRLPEPLPGVYGDRIVLRSFSPLRTIAGGRILNPLGRKVKRFDESGLARLTGLSVDDQEAVLGMQLTLAGAEGLSLAQLRTMAGLEAKALDKALQSLLSKGEAFLFERETRRYASGQVVDELCESALAFVDAFHKTDPMKQGVLRGELASTWGRALPERLFHAIVERLLKRGELVAEAEALRLKGHKVSLAADQEKLREAVLGAYASGGETPPNLKDVLEPLGVSYKEAAGVFRLLMEQGKLVKVKEDMFFHAEALGSIRSKVVSFLEQSGEMAAPDFKTITGLSRKFAIPLLEHFDKDKLTVRVGDKRRLRKR
ncbi:selenocysteine-specific translation elongation factor [Desulfovibrio ferrophilus]|uniref:Selenocysteine-specific elongation factor n=1 Tax=Desulfovibrio ferrophilus TaxID=241368 RepID=A0A2Z6AYZ7_9BACT|nr:selenocysteine-specific translation elongation factor [Desulfovibrio ferrophilus]BBD08413.1 selenocysteine-specific translation elongation factor [Desulfovibrio ferrophilus]